MATKREELEGRGCLCKAGLDEPIFVLRANDPCAPTVVRVWANIARALLLHEPDKCDGAEEDARKMEAWQREFLTPERRWPGSDD